MHNPNEGDLVRVGYLYANPCPKSEVSRQFNIPRQYQLLSEIPLRTKQKFDVFNIGDSFSDQDSFSYHNFLAANGLSVLNADKFISRDLVRYISADNPIQTLIELLNGNFFDSIKADYIVLQSVERHFNQRIEEVDFKKKLRIDELENRVENGKTTIKVPEQRFFSATTLKIPLTNFQFLFNSKPTFSKTHKFKINTTQLFSNQADNLLCYEDDLNKMNWKNDSLATLESIKVIDAIHNLVQEKNMKLVVLVCPDKYDIYYPYIANKENGSAPTFYSIYDNTQKKYMNIDSYGLLTEALAKEKDLYFYDDSHWSPKAAKLIADAIYNQVQ